jgi:hypothetical protein
MNARVSHSANRRLRRPPDAAPTAPPIRALAVAATDKGWWCRNRGCRVPEL